MYTLTHAHRFRFGNIYLGVVWECRRHRLENMNAIDRECIQSNYVNMNYIELLFKCKFNSNVIHSNSLYGTQVYSKWYRLIDTISFQSKSNIGINKVWNKLVFSVVCFSAAAAAAVETVVIIIGNLLLWINTNDDETTSPIMKQISQQFYDQTWKWIHKKKHSHRNFHSPAQLFMQKSTLKWFQLFVHFVQCMEKLEDFVHQIERSKHTILCLSPSIRAIHSLMVIFNIEYCSEYIQQIFSAQHFL